MRSGFPHSQGGAYSAFQRRSDVGVLPSPQDISTAPVPVVQPENGIQNSMVATQYPGELRVAYTPAKLQPGYAQSQQNFQELHHHQGTQASRRSTGVQHPVPTDSKYTSCNSHQQICREDNAEFHSSAHVSAQRSSYFGTSANDSGKQRECHRQYFSRHFLKGSNSNQNPAPKKRYFNSSSSASTTATGHKAVKSSPLLTALLKGNNSDSKYSTTLSFSSEETNDNTEVITTTNFSDERHRKAQPVKGSLLKCGRTRTQSLDNSGGSHSDPHQQQVRLPSLSSQSSTENVRPVRKTKPPTNEEIMDYINKSVAESLKNRNDEHSNKDSDRVYSLQSDSIMAKVDSAAHLPTTSAPDKEDVERRSLNCAVTEQCTAALGQELEEDSSKGSKANAELTQRVEETDDGATPASEKHLTGTLVVENSKYAAKIKPVESALVDFDLSVKKHLGTPPYESEGEEALSMKTVKNLFYEDISDDDMLQLATKLPNPEHVEVSFPARSENPIYEDISEDESGQIEYISEYPQIMREVAATCTKTEEESPVVFTSMPGMTWDHLTEKQTSLTLNHSMSQKQKTSPWSNIKDLDAKDEVPEAHSEIPIYEDISEDESQQIECISGDTSSPTQAPEPNVKHSPFENEAYGPVQGQALMRTEIVPDEELTPKKQDSTKTAACIISQQYSKTDPGFEGQLFPKHDSEKLQNHSVSCSPYPILTEGDETDDEMDVDWLFIPVVVSDLKFEANNEDQDSPQENVLDVGETGEQGRQCDTSPTHWPSPNPEASAFSPLEVFDTLETLQQMTAVKINTVAELGLGRSTPEHEMDSEGEPLTPQNRRESVDSCETEDSLDYSPELERNFMTVSKKLLESSASLPSETDVVVTAKEGESSEVTNMQKVQTRCLNKSGSLQRLREPIKIKAASKRVQPKTNGKKISKKDEISISSSDLEDECDQNCKKRAKRTRFFSSSSDDSEDAENSRGETVEKRFQNNSLPSRDLPAQQHQSTRHDSLFADLSHSTEECGQMIGTKAASEHVQHNRQSVSKEEIITIHDTDSEDDSSQNYKKPSGKRFFSSGSDSDDDSCVEEMRESCGTVVSQCETAEDKIQETQLSIADSSLSQHLSKLYDTQLEEVKRNARSDVSHRMKKSGELIETKGESEHVQNMTNRQRTLKRRVTSCDSDEVVKKICSSKKKAYTQELLLSESEDSGNDLISAKNRPSTENAGHLCRTGSAQPHKNRLSSKDSPEKQHQSADKEAISTLDPNHLIPRLLVVEPSQPAERVHKQGKSGTLPPKISTISSKKLDTCEKNKPHLYRNTQPKPRPENDKHHAKENNTQAIVPKSRTVSRQFSLPSQDGPSTSPRSLPFTSGQLSEARKRSAYSRNMSLPGEATSFCSAPPSKQGSSIPTQHLSPKLHRSHSTPSTVNPRTNTEGLSFSEKNPSSLRERLKKDWKKHYPPVPSRTRRNGKTSLGMNKNLRTLSDSFRETRPGPSHCDRVPKQRRSSHKTTPPLMKRSRTEAIQRTNDIHRDPTATPMGRVGKNYKWKNSDKAHERIELDWEDK